MAVLVLAQSELIYLIKIEKSKNGWIVYESRNFKKFHTHVKHLRVAKKIKRAVTTLTVPNTECIELLISCIRLSTDKKYIHLLEQKIKYLEEN